MRAVRPYVTTGVALVGASVISAAPLAPPPTPDHISNQISNRQVSLRAASSTMCAQGSGDLLCGSLGGPPTGQPTGVAAGSEPSLLHIPQNLANAFLSIPAWEIQAMQRLADALIATGSWQVWSPTNVFGFDEQDPPKLQAVIDMLIPFQPFSSTLGEDLSWWARANLPMSAGCAALPGACPDPDVLLDSMFGVSMSRLYEGYTFPAVTNPFTGEPTSWSGRYVQLEPWGPFTSAWESLVAPPRPVETVSFGDAFETTQRLVTSGFSSFYPFVQNSEWYNDDQTGLAPSFRALAPILCKSCDPVDPYDNPWLYENYPPDFTAPPEFTQRDPNSGSTGLAVDSPADRAAASAPAVPAVEADANWEVAEDGEDADVGGESDDPDPMPNAVTDTSPEEPEFPGTDESSVAAAEAEADEVSESAGRHRGYGRTSVQSIGDEVESQRSGSSDDESDSSDSAADSGGAVGGEK